MHFRTYGSLNPSLNLVPTPICSCGPARAPCRGVCARSSVAKQGPSTGGTTARGTSLMLSRRLDAPSRFLLELSRFERVRRRQGNSRSAFMNTLLRGIAVERIQKIGDVHDSYRAFFRVGTLRASHLEEISEFLRSAMALGASSPPRPSDARQHGTGQLLEKLLAANQRALEVEQQCVPFSGTPEPERQLLEEISRLATTDGAVGKLAALARAIRIRQDLADWLDRERGWSLRLAKWGWLGTVGFSLLSILLGILALGG